MLMSSSPGEDITDGCGACLTTTTQSVCTVEPAFDAETPGPECMEVRSCTVCGATTAIRHLRV